MSFDKQRRVQSGQALVGALVVWTLSLPAAIPAYFATFVTLYFATLPVTAVTTDQAWLNIVCLAIFGTLLVIAPLLTAIQAFAATLVVRPSRAAADAGALALTRYPPPLRRLLVRARTAKTRPALLPLGLGAIWSLPVGTENSKSENLLWRIRRLDSLDPDGTIRSLGG
jgi:hypothetical protein